MGKFGETYDRILNELAPVALAPALPAVKAAGSTAVVRGLAALGGGLATVMNNKTKTSTKTKQKAAKPDMVATSSKALPGVEGPIVQSKFDEYYNSVVGDFLTELISGTSADYLRSATRPVASPVGGAPKIPMYTQTPPGTTYQPALKGVGRLSPTGPTSQTTQVLKAADKAVSNVAKQALTKVPAIAAAAGDVAATGAGAAFPIAATGAALGAAQQSMQRFGQKMTDLGVSAPRQLPPGTVGLTGKAVTAPTVPTTPTSTPSQPDIQTGTLIPSPNTSTDTVDAVAQPQTATQAQGMGKAQGIATGIGAALAAAPALLRIPQGVNNQTRSRTGRGFGLDLIPTDSKELPGVEGPVVQDKFYIQ